MFTHTTQLSRREWEVLELVARGMQLTQVAERLVISPYTVKTHTRTIRLKLGASNAAHAIYLAMVNNNTTCGV